MFERFTDRARHVIVLAQEEAKTLNHNYIGTEHILLGLIHEGGGVAAQALESVGISLDAVRERVQAIVGQGNDAPTGHIPFTPRAKKVLELSLREAVLLSHNYIGTEHILLGLIHEGDGVAAEILVALGADLDGTREVVRALMTSYEDRATARAGDLVDQAFGGRLVSLTQLSDRWDETIEGRNFEDEIARIMVILARRESSNAVILAEPGADGRALLLALARKFRDGSPDARYRELYELDLGRAEAADGEEDLSKLPDAITHEAAAGSVFFVPDIHALATENPNSLAAGVRKRLIRGEIRIVTILTEEGYRSAIRNVSDLDGLFDTVTLAPPTLEDAMTWLKGMRDRYEAHHKIQITDSAVVAAAIVADAYLDEGDLYSRARALIDRAGARLRIAMSNPPVDLRELDDKIAAVRIQKEKASEDQDFELAASLRDQEKQLLAQRLRQEKLWRLEGVDASMHAVVDEDMVLSTAVELTGVSETRLRASVAGRAARDGQLAASGDYRILNDRPVIMDADDLLGTKATAKRLAAILNASRHAAPFILAIDGGWGVGKSSLLRLIEAELTDSNVVTVPFNAWTAQGELALESLVKSVLVELDPWVLRRWVRKAARQRHVSVIARVVASIGARLLGASRLVDQFWAQAGASDELRNNLRSSIEGMLQEWVDSDPRGGGKRSLIVFVDDLDRCAEDTVVRMCEAMKLYLDAPGLIFVLACDLSVLADGVSSTTGLSERAGRAYLEKIIQVAYRLPPPSGEHIRRLIDAYTQESRTTALVDPIIVEILAEQAGRNPRRIKRILNSFVLTSDLDPMWHVYPLDPTHALTANLLQHIYPQVYDFIVSPDAGNDPIGAFLDFATLKRRATEIPRADDPWWGTATRVFRRAGLPVPRHEAGADITNEVLLVERTLPQGFPEYARNEELIRLLRGVGNVNTRIAMRSQLISSPLPAQPVTQPSSTDEASPGTPSTSRGAPSSQALPSRSTAGS
ncbi:hypothetical protein GCM10025760_33320 [Microbacterium yannicii]|uniref:AAA family ATPase n=1 Tax=Microbacterium yannicii TaxID=671622 RepID=A0ABP9MLD3_9MICO|nr:P-loop NTPase fold protein [Microbacterium yannicii]MCO5951801.1 P-loop NTPase fold protein [Microbacterium yannicii]